MAPLPKKAAPLSRQASVSQCVSGRIDPRIWAGMRGEKRRQSRSGKAVFIGPTFVNKRCSGRAKGAGPEGARHGGSGTN